jgi:predicted nucleic acid-binding protein
MIVYVETSAAAKLLVAEPESIAVRDYLAALVEGGNLVFAGRILETELRRIVVRQGMSQQAATAVLDLIDVVEHSRNQFREAGMLPVAQLRSLDALHLATALDAQADAMITFDERLEEACAAVGLAVLSVS